MQDNPLHTQDNPEYAKGYLCDMQVNICFTCWYF